MKSPFLIFREFISPLQCEDIISGNNNLYPQVDKFGNPIPLFFGNNLVEVRLIPKLEEEVIPKMEDHYNTKIKGIKPFTMEWYPEGYTSDKIKPRCENSAFIGGKWMRINDNDFTGILFLNEYQNEVPFDEIYEVYGGELEFPNHKFSFRPQRGTLVIFPGAPNFLNATASIESGELTQIRIHIASENLFVYDKNLYTGDYKTWFKGE